jgi:large subunit ribosomal protein L25
MELKVQKRQPGKTKKLIKQGLVPGIVYGKSLEQPINIQFKRTDFVKLYKEAGSSTPVILKGDDFEQMVLIHDYQLEPVKDMVIHVDFLAIKAGEKVKAAVPVVVE